MSSGKVAIKIGQETHSKEVTVDKGRKLCDFISLSFVIKNCKPKLNFKTEI
jgi:hypothetical protein